LISSEDGEPSLKDEEQTINDDVDYIER